MDIIKQDIEIMAPAGSYESLMAAIQGGAGSVYFGVEQLNMRAKSSNNFTIADLAEIVSICNQHGVKSYLTVNIVVYDKDIEKMRDIIDAAKTYGVSAIIAADMAAVVYARSVGVEVHVSTQANVSNIEALRYWAQYADVVVLARELTLIQVRGIYDAIHRDQITGPSGQLVRIEMFVHGALCMAISSKCYLSLHERNASANRGACQQICRKAYTVTEKDSGHQLEIDNEYIMSPKDLCTVSFLNEVLEAGCVVLKIEGRARSPEYVKKVVSVYKTATEAFLAGEFSEEKGNQWKSELETVFNRGFWDGYYLGQRLGEWSANYGSKATVRKAYVAKVVNYFPRLGVAELLVEAGNLAVGQEFIITGPSTGVVEGTVSEIRIDFVEMQDAVKGSIMSMPVPSRVRKGDKLYKMLDAKFVEQQ